MKFSFRLFVLLLMTLTVLFSISGLIFSLNNDFNSLMTILTNGYIGGAGIIFSNNIRSRIKKYLLIGLSFFILVSTFSVKVDTIQILNWISIITVVLIIQPWKGLSFSDNLE